MLENIWKNKFWRVVAAILPTSLLGIRYIHKNQKIVFLTEKLAFYSQNVTKYLIFRKKSQKYMKIHSLQAANDPTLMKRRLWRYVGPVTLVSILLNTSKFFEAYVDKDENDEYSISISLHWLYLWKVAWFFFPFQKSRIWGAITFILQ